MRARESSDEDHFFYVWNPDTNWHQIFEQCQRREPLGFNFGGYHNHLQTLLVWMSLNRNTLRQEEPDRRDPIFHLLIPTYYPIVVNQPIALHEGLFPLVITAQMQQNTRMVWFHLGSRSDELVLENIGNLGLVGLEAGSESGVDTRVRRVTISTRFTNWLDRLCLPNTVKKIGKSLGIKFAARFAPRELVVRETFVRVGYLLLGVP